MREIPESSKAPAFWTKFAWLCWLMIGVVLGRFLFPVEKIDMRPAEVAPQPVGVSVPAKDRVIEVKPPEDRQHVVVRSPWGRLGDGMTEAQVLALLGAPLRKEFVGQTRTYWYYGPGSEEAYVDFFGGIVYRWREPGR